MLVATPSLARTASLPLLLALALGMAACPGDDPAVVETAQGHVSHITPYPVHPGQVDKQPEFTTILDYTIPLDKAVVLVGQGKKFELWNKDTWEQMIAKAAPLTPGSLPPELEGFSL